MAGHSKWANIQHRKNAQDARRGKLFTKLIREITTAARTGGPDPSANPRLRAAIDKALDGNMTRETIERAVNRGAGAGEGADFEAVRYEGYGAGGVAVMVECLTDNRNRTVGEVRYAFTRHGGNLGTDGSVAYLFSKIGLLSFSAGSDEARIMEVALDAGAEDVITNDDGSIDVTTTPEGFSAVKQAMTTAGLRPALAELTMQAATETELDPETAEKVLKMVDVLEDLDDVQHVYTNASIGDDVVAQR